MSLTLAATTKSITAVLGSSPATQPRFVGVYIKRGPGVFEEVPIEGDMNSTSSVEIVPAPAAGFRHILAALEWYNKHSASVTVTFRLTTTGPTHREFLVVTVAAGYTWHYNAHRGWWMTDANGQIVQTGGGGGGTPGGSDGDIQYNNAGAFGGFGAYDAGADQVTLPGLTVEQDFALAGVISPAQITADQDDYAPTGHATATAWRLSTDTLRNLTGLAGGAAGRIVAIINVGAALLGFTHEDSGSTDVNRFNFPNSHDFNIWPGQVVKFIYDGDDERWRILEIGVVNLDNGNQVFGVLPVANGGTGLAVEQPKCRVYHNANQSINNATLTALSLNSEYLDTDAMHFTSDAALTGTVAKTASSTQLVGTGTAFLSELSVGQVISVPGTATELRVVTAIADDTHLTVAVAFANNASGQTAARVSGAIVIRTAGRYNLGAQVEFAPHATGARLVTIRRETTGLDVARTSDVTVGASIETRVDAVAQAVDCAQWDWFRIYAFQNSGGALNVTTSSDYSPVFTAVRLT